MNPSLEEMSAEQLIEQVLLQARVINKQTTEIGFLNTEKITQNVQLETKAKENQDMHAENERLLGVIAELKEDKKAKGAK